MTNRVRLTEAAATRFPDLAGRTGTAHDVTEYPRWLRIDWDGLDDEPIRSWLIRGDVETVGDEAELPPLDPSDPNAPAP